MEVLTMSLSRYLTERAKPEAKTSIAQILARNPIEVLPNRACSRINLTAYGKAVSRALGESGMVTAIIEQAVYRTGPKIIRLGQMNYEALENTEVNVAWCDYQQPYPVMLVELPQHYAQNRVTTCPQHYEEFHGFLLPATHSPVFVKVFYDSEQRLLISSVVFSSSQSIEKLCFEKPGVPTLENIFHASSSRFPGSAKSTDTEQEFSDRALRVALNACLLVTQGGYEPRADNPAQLSNLQRKLNVARTRRQPERVKAMREAIKAHPLVWEMDQNIQLWDSLEATVNTGHGDGKPRRPHWRRGHWRQQPHGVGRQQRKLLFIKPILINRTAFVGDVSASTATYTLPRKPR